MIASSSITVEPSFPDDEAPRVWQWCQRFRAAVADDYSPETLEEFLRAWEAKREAEIRYAVRRDGELGGIVTIRPHNPVCAESHVVFKPSFFGRETTVPALAQVYALTFEAGYEKIFSVVFHENSQIRGLAKVLGATTEATLKQHTRKAGKLQDIVILAIYRESFLCHSLRHSDRHSLQ